MCVGQHAQARSLDSEAQGHAQPGRMRTGAAPGGARTRGRLAGRTYCSTSPGSSSGGAATARGATARRGASARRERAASRLALPRLQRCELACVAPRAHGVPKAAISHPHGLGRGAARFVGPTDTTGGAKGGTRRAGGHFNAAPGAVMSVLTWQLLLAPRATPNAAGRAARCSAAPCASPQQRAAALRRLCAAPDEASASLRSSSAERLVSFDEFLARSARSATPAQPACAVSSRLTPPRAGASGQRRV